MAVAKPDFVPGVDKFVWDTLPVVRPSKKARAAAADRVDALLDTVVGETETTLEAELMRALTEVLRTSGAMVLDRLRQEKRRG